MKRASSLLLSISKAFLICLFVVLTVSCSESPDSLLPEPETPEKPDDPAKPDDPEKPAVEIAITLPEAIELERRSSADVAVSISANIEELPEWVCTSSNDAIASVTKKDAKAITVRGISAGVATVTVSCTADGRDFSASMNVAVTPGTIKILAIGNSFSQDAVEQYLYELADAAGIKVVIGNMYIGGCDLDKHWNNLTNDSPSYEYRKVENGNKANRSSMTISAALADEPWDYISLQQVSGKSGRYETFTNLPNMIKSVNATVPDATLIWHQTWAYASTSNHASFPDYGSDQMTMYRAIVDASRKAMNDNPELKILVPSGTAIQNARTAYVGDVFNRDGYHLEVTYGRYTAACTWFETLFGIDVTTNSYAPATVSDEMASIARLAAHRAVQNPDNVTTLGEYSTPDVKDGYITSAVYIDFGPNSLSAAPWNNFTTFSSDADPAWIKDTDGNFVNLGVAVEGGFTGSYLGVSGEDKMGPLTVNGVEIPVTAWKDGLIVAGTKGAGNVGPGRLKISKLNPDGKYDFDIVAVRYNGSREARVTAYRLKGKTESEEKQIKPGMKSADYSAGKFENYYVTFAGVQPASDGTVTIEVTGVDTGSAAEGHLNALIISPR